jgi:peptidoglycan/xylan/chitin deacetylase (PgdA/CDA1 family)
VSGAPRGVCAREDGPDVRASARKILIDLLAALGVYRLFRFLNRKRVAILFYHGVSASERFEGIRNYQGKHVRLSRFRAQLDFLRRHYRVLPLPEVVDALRRGARLPANTAVITFDDGYENNATVAVPALSEAGMSAAFFLSTSYVDTDRCLWVDEIEQVIASTSLPELVVRDGERDERLPLTSDADRRAADRRIRAIGKALPDEALWRWLKEFFAHNGLEVPRATRDYRFLTWDQVRGMHAAGMTIGSHTLRHAIITRVPEAERVEEILGARRACEAALGVRCDTFAYANGREGDFDDSTGRLLKELGFSCALTTVQGLNVPGDDLSTLKRMGVGDATTVAELEAQMSGFMAWALGLRARLRR